MWKMVLSAALASGALFGGSAGDGLAQERTGLLTQVYTRGLARIAQDEAARRNPAPRVRPTRVIDLKPGVCCKQRK